MSRLVKLEWAALSALCLLVASTNPIERIFFGVSTVAILWTVHFIFKAFRKFLSPVFQILFAITLIGTLLEVLRFIFPFSLNGALPQTVFAAFLMSMASQKISEKFEMGILFLVFIFIAVLAQNTNLIITNFYPAIFIVVAFSLAALNFLYAARKKNSKSRRVTA